MGTRTQNVARTLLVLVAALVTQSAHATAQTESATSQKVSVDFDREANFARCTTYSWVAGQPARNPFADALIVSKIDEALTAKGWKKVDSDPTCLVMYQASLKEKKPAQAVGSWGPGWGVSSGPADVRVNRMLEGMLVVDIGDAASRQIIWRGVATETIADTDATNEQKLSAIMKAMFRAFPPGATTPRIP